MKKLMILFAAVALFVACSDDDDERIIPKEYGTTKFSADLKHEPHQGMAGDFTCKQQTYMKLGEVKPVHVGKYGEDSWTTFDILPKIPNEDKELVDNPNYNVSTNVKGWDLLFTQYKGNARKGSGEVMPYFLAGILINAESVKVALHKYEASKEDEAISKAFSALTLADVANVAYSSEIDFIGISWKGMSGMPPKYSPKTNWFYIVKTTSGETYKVRFTSVYGKSKDDRVFTCEYALMK